MQSHFSTLLLDENGDFTFSLLAKDPLFWITLGIWVVVNFIFLVVNQQRKNDDIVMRQLIKDKSKLIANVTQKARRGDYSGAKETMEILKELQNIVEEDE